MSALLQQHERWAADELQRKGHTLTEIARMIGCDREMVVEYLYTRRAQKLVKAPAIEVVKRKYAGAPK